RSFRLPFGQLRSPWSRADFRGTARLKPCPDSLFGVDGSRQEKANAIIYRVCVTLLSARGRSGSNPFTSARQAANSCAGTIYGIGVYKSAGRECLPPSACGIQMTWAAPFLLAARSAARLLRSVMIRASDLMRDKWVIMRANPGKVTPPGVNK